MQNKEEITKELNVYRARDLESYKRSKVVKQIEVLAANDSCDVCKNYMGRKFGLQDTPILPIKDCKRKWCRCTYIPVVE